MSIFGQLRRAAASGILLLAIMALAQGCSGEHTNPLPVEKMGATAGSDESMALDLDARGYLNGIFIPGNINVYGYNRYPVSYVGSWTLFNSNVREGYYMARSSSPGARIDVVGTMTRVIFDFWDYRLYKDPGEVSFWLDGTQVGKFSLARSS